MKKLLPLLALLLLLSGCAAEEPDDMSAPGWEEYQQQEKPQEEPELVLPSEFALAYHKDHTLDPLTCGEGIQQDVASLLYEPLFRLDETFHPIGVLCEDAQWDESGLVCTLMLRSDVSFSDGSELTARDVFETLSRAMTSQRYAYRLRGIASLNYSNRSHTVTITLLEKNSALLSLLDIAIVKAGTDTQLVPIGTGPYLFTEDEDGVRLTANPAWWQQKPLPVDSITLIHAKDEATAVHLFTTDRISLLTLDPTDGHSAVSGKTALSERATTLLHFIGFNTTSGVFSDRAVRKAVSAAIDRNVLVDAFLSDHAVAAYFPISPLSDLYPTELETVYKRTDITSALTQAGCNTGEMRELILLVNEEDSFRLDNAGYIAEQLSLLDLQITVRALPWTEYLVALQQGDFDLYYAQVRLCADWDLSDLVGTNGTMNYGRFTDLWLDTLIATLQESSDRAAAANNLYAYFAQQTPIAPICFQNYTVLTHPDVIEGMAVTPGDTFGSFDNWTIHLAQ